MKIDRSKRVLGRGCLCLVEEASPIHQRLDIFPFPVPLLSPLVLFVVVYLLGRNSESHHSLQRETNVNCWCIFWFVGGGIR